MFLIPTMDVLVSFPHPLCCLWSDLSMLPGLMVWAAIHSSPFSHLLLQILNPLQLVLGGTRLKEERTRAFLHISDLSSPGENALHAFCSSSARQSLGAVAGAFQVHVCLPAQISQLLAPAVAASAWLVKVAPALLSGDSRNHRSPFLYSVQCKEASSQPRKRCLSDLRIFTLNLSILFLCISLFL